MSKLFEAYAKHEALDISTLQFYFNGKKVEGDDTPDMVNVHISSPYMPPSLDLSCVYHSVPLAIPSCSWYSLGVPSLYLYSIKHLTLSTQCCVKAVTTKLHVIS